MSTDDNGRAAPVPYEDRLAIATPEGLEIELTLAGIGSRFIAGGLDFSIQLIVLGALALVLQPAGDAGVAILTSSFFAIIFFYDVLFEVLGGGRTPGKRLTGLRVVRSGGRPITFVRSALRNILRIVDIMPLFYGVGMTAIFITRRNQRLGDLAAGSLVVRDRHGDRATPPVLHEPADLGPAADWDVSGVTAADVATVRSFLERRPLLEDHSRRALAADLAGRLRPRVGGAHEQMRDEFFLELLVAAKAARSASCR
jgi:uncharacterized RDD family membrane protein YckC